MLVSGFRHPFLGRYKVGFNKDGKIVGVETNLYANAGENYVMRYQIRKFSIKIRITPAELGNCSYRPRR